MIDRKAYDKAVLLKYCIIALFFCLLSLIGLFFKEWVVIPCCVICSIVGFFVTKLLLSADLDSNMGTTKSTKFVISLILRYALMSIGLALCGLLVLVTMGDPAVKTRYLILVVSAIPYFIPTIALLLTKIKKD